MKSLSAEDWSWIERRAQTYRLLPKLGSIFASHDDWPVPKPLRESSGVALRQSAFRSLVMQQALIEIGELFDSHRISYCALKGASLSLEFYAEPALRPMRDLDIMVAPDQAEKAYQHLLEAGYKKLPGRGGYGMEYAHHLPPLANANGVLLELHHRIAPREWSGSLPLGQRLLLNARLIEFQGHLVRMAHPTDTFLHLVVHASFQHLFDNGPCLLSDLSELEKSGLVDHTAARTFANKHDLMPSLELILAMRIRYGKGGAKSVETQSRVPETMLNQAAKLMTQDPDKHWQRFWLRKRRSMAKRIFEGVARALRPTEKDLAKTAQRDVKGVEAWRYYPAWLFKRTSVYLGAEFQTGLDSEAASDAELERWLGRPN
ncbi:MAG: nucleotidyltransferase family protein [Pseudomonadota bacterium]